MTSERLEAQRSIDADAAAIFQLLCDPQGHVAIDSSGMLMDATGEPVNDVGDSFVVHMDREALNDYPLLPRLSPAGVVPVPDVGCFVRGGRIPAAGAPSVGAALIPAAVSIRSIPASRSSIIASRSPRVRMSVRVGMLSAPR